MRSLSILWLLGVVSYFGIVLYLVVRCVKAAWPPGDKLDAKTTNTSPEFPILHSLRDARFREQCEARRTPEPAFMSEIKYEKN